MGRRSFNQKQILREEDEEYDRVKREFWAKICGRSDSRKSLTPKVQGGATNSNEEMMENGSACGSSKNCPATVPKAETIGRLGSSESRETQNTKNSGPRNPSDSNAELTRQKLERQCDFLRRKLEKEDANGSTVPTSTEAIPIPTSTETSQTSSTSSSSHSRKVRRRDHYARNFITLKYRIARDKPPCCPICRNLVWMVIELRADISETEERLVNALLEQHFAEEAELRRLPSTASSFDQDIIGSLESGQSLDEYVSAISQWQFRKDNPRFSVSPPHPLRLSPVLTFLHERNLIKQLKTLLSETGLEKAPVGRFHPTDRDHLVHPSDCTEYEIADSLGGLEQEGFESLLCCLTCGIAECLCTSRIFGTGKRCISQRRRRGWRRAMMRRCPYCVYIFILIGPIVRRLMQAGCAFGVVLFVLLALTR